MSTAPPFPFSTKELPPTDQAIFFESSFFSRNGPGAELPTPADIRARSNIQDPGVRHEASRIPPVRYEELGLIVKFGGPPCVTVDEGQCLWALRHALPQVPVPEIYGWTHDGGQVFIYMELVPGATLEQRWDSLNEAEREGICEQLRTILSELRNVRHGPGEFFVGRINYQPLSDIIFETPRNDPPGGPFHSVAEFHDWMSILIRTGFEQHWPGKKPSELPDPCRERLPDDAPVVFTHGDLHPSNIMVSADSPCKVVAIVDWHQSGWYPDYWEFCKAVFTADLHGEWRNRYIPLFLHDAGLVLVWDHYAGSLGY
ncbi:kinase-like domain-containing protein [Chaetomium fimeti]|uniref:Kinase-like domain-containing protein n=1 Tax=Chaetomium fimeti TaxID=1854472 RepID=A0AAE0H5P1_9PEZI|nr:kinase-like domain-containing protein [Chaetomium fimeti]